MALKTSSHYPRANSLSDNEYNTTVMWPWITSGTTSSFAHDWDTFRRPRGDKYDGSTDPMDHVNVHLLAQSSMVHILRRYSMSYLPNTLKGTAYQWFVDLPITSKHDSTTLLACRGNMNEGEQLALPREVGVWQPPCLRRKIFKSHDQYLYVGLSSIVCSDPNSGKAFPSTRIWMCNPSTLLFYYRVVRASGSVHQEWSRWAKKGKWWRSTCCFWRQKKESLPK